jgi:hypothetical protein
MMGTKEIVLHNGDRGDLSSAPSIHSGTGAPTDADDRANGTLYLRRNPAGAGSVLYVKASGAYSTVPTVAGTDFGGGGILADVVGESGAGVGVTVDGVLLKDGDVLITDANVIKFGTPGTDIVFTADGADVVVTGTGDLVYADSVDVYWGTGKDLRIYHDGTDSLLVGSNGDIVIDNTDVNDAIILRVGADSSATTIDFRNNSDATMWSVIPTSATAGQLKAADGSALVLGAGADDSLSHDGTNTTWTHATGNLVIDNQALTGQTYLDLGTDDSATSVAVRNNSGSAMWSVTGAGVVKQLDNVSLVVGTGSDLTIVHNGTNTLVTSTTGNLVVDNTNVTGATYFDLGTDTSATSWAVRNNSGTALLTVLGSNVARLADSSVLAFGADSDIVYTHNGTASVVVSNAAAGTVGYHDDVLNIVDPADVTKAVRIDAGQVTAGQTRVINAPDADVHQDSWVRRATGTIATGDVATMNATPVEVIAAPGAGKFIEIVSVYWFLDFNSAAYDAAAAGDTLGVKYTNGSGAQLVDTVAGNAIGSAAADYHVIVKPVAEVQPVANAAVVAHIDAGEWGTGNSPLKYEILYRVRTLQT